MLEVAQFLATLCCTMFAGAAVYINLVEHPARMGCDTKTAECVNNFETPVAGSLVSNAVLPRLGAAWVLEG